MVNKKASASPDEISRYTIILPNDHQARLAVMAKTYKLSQGEILEGLIEHADMEKLGPIFAKMREDKVAGRQSKKELLKRLSKLDPEQLKALERIAAGEKVALS